MVGVVQVGAVVEDTSKPDRGQAADPSRLDVGTPSIADVNRP